MQVPRAVFPKASGKRHHGRGCHTEEVHGECSESPSFAEEGDERARAASSYCCKQCRLGHIATLLRTRGLLLPDEADVCEGPAQE